MRSLHSLRRHLSLTHAAAERCYVKKTRERLFPPIVYGLLEYFLCMHMWVWLPNVCVCVCVPALCGCLGAAHKCVSVLAPVGKKDLYTGLKSLIKGWQMFLASCVVLKQLLGSSSLSLPPFFCSHLLLSLITEGAVGGVCSSPGFVLTSFIAVLLEEPASSCEWQPLNQQSFCRERYLLHFLFPNVGVWTQVSCSSPWYQSSCLR